MTESETGVLSEELPTHAPGKPGQHHEAGKVFHC